MLQNARVADFTVSELLRENQQGVKLPPTRLGLIQEFPGVNFEYFLDRLFSIKVKNIVFYAITFEEFF